MVFKKNKLTVQAILTLGLIFLMVGSVFSYTVKKGDTLYKIAKENNVSVGLLAKTNGMTERHQLKVGQNIKIPAINVEKTVSTDNSSDAIKRSSGEKRVINTDAFAPAIEDKKAEVAETKAETPIKTADKPKYSEKLVEPISAGKPNPYSSDIVKVAMSLRGSRYISGGTSRGGFDCSGFTTYVYNQFGIKLPRTSASQSTVGRHVNKSELKEGDLVLFATRRSGVSHVGIYVGNGNFIHAANTRKGVTVDSINSSYYKKTYVGARRVK